MGDFKLSATLKGHEDDVSYYPVPPFFLLEGRMSTDRASLMLLTGNSQVRAVTFPTRQTLLSASRDNTVRHWSLQSPTPPTYDGRIVLQGSHWFTALAYTPPSSQFPDGAFAAAGRETFVYVKQLGRPLEEDPHRLLIGHAGNIACLSFSPDGRKIISGGWDSQVFAWDVEQGNVIAELADHGGPVWGVMMHDEKAVLTACADQRVRLFDPSGKSLKSFRGHTDVVRCFCRIPSGHWSGADFASAGNDEVIRLWALTQDDPVCELHGHEAYIYSLAILPDGDIASSSEDRTVRVWRDGQCVQTITHPAISIWTVAACPETGDIASGASDNIIRIFSRDPERQAEPEVCEENPAVRCGNPVFERESLTSSQAIIAFDETNRMYAIPAETASQGQPFQKENLPGPGKSFTTTIVWRYGPC